MEKLKMLWTGEFDQEGFDEFSKYFDITLDGNAVNPFDFDTPMGKPANEVIKSLEGIDVYLCGYEPVTEEVLKNCPDLKLILSVRDGPEENIDVKACEKLGIPVISSAGRCTVSVAELTFALMMLLARPIIKMTNFIRYTGWTQENNLECREMYDTYATELFNKTVGIVGLGRNGYQVAQYCKPFNMKVMAYDPYVNKEKMEAEGIKIVDLETLMKEADYVVVLARLTDDTYQIINASNICLMKKTACLINTARGKLIDNEALLDALEKGDIKAAAIDAFPSEPIGKECRYMNIPADRLILTPHMAGKTVERNWHQCQLLLNQFRDFISGKEVRMAYTPHVKEAVEYANRGGKLITK